MSPSLDGTLPESVISQENISPLTFYIFAFFLDIYSLSSSIINACTIILALTYLSIKVEGRYIFIKSKTFCEMYVGLLLFCEICVGLLLFCEICVGLQFHRQSFCCDMTDCIAVPPERTAYKKSIKTLKKS